MTDLKLIALEAEDLKILSVHLQDAVLNVGDIAYLPRERRLAALFNRFDWSDAEVAGQAKSGQTMYTRRRCALRFENVKGARLKNIDLADKKQVLNLLAIQFEPHGADDPSGFVSLVFAGDAGILLDVDCIEAEMRDLGGAWATASKPEHSNNEA